MGLFGMGVYQGYPYLEFRKPDFKHILKNPVRTFLAFIYVSEVYQRCIRGVGKV